MVRDREYLRSHRGHELIRGSITLIGASSCGLGWDEPIAGYVGGAMPSGFSRGEEHWRSATMAMAHISILERLGGKAVD